MGMITFQRMRAKKDEKPSIREAQDDWLDGLTVKELKEYAASNGIDFGAAKKKDEILAVIREAQDEGK